MTTGRPETDRCLFELTVVVALYEIGLAATLAAFVGILVVMRDEGSLDDQKLNEES